MQRSQMVLSGIRISLVFLTCISLFASSVLSGSHEIKPTTVSSSNIVSKISTHLEIPAGSDYYIQFDSKNLTLVEQPCDSSSSGLSQQVVAAIAKSPRWIQQELTSQFQVLSSPEPYAMLLLNVSTQYADEIAFCIACSPVGNVPPVDVITDNTFSLYEHDQWLKYADIIDYDDGAGDYYSTIRYTVLENGEEKQVELPKEIYYWYVVHPKIAGEVPGLIYDAFWRCYMFNHNDIGYPLLKEKLSDIQYLWDGESYAQPANRLWDQCIAQHPTAIEAVSYWIGKTVPYGAMGDRPGDPNVIAHEHNGWCGELQRIAVAAQRAALIPSIGASNVGEDHVWREFYERGWHENDNWWTDSGGAVDQPDVYAYGWAKNMSAIFTWKGDDTTYDVTPRYIHPEDRITVTFTVKDAYLKPMDGARIIVLVHGLKDITWYKNYAWEKIQALWDKLPDVLKGRIMQSLFNRLKEQYERIPDVINGVTITRWNYTDVNGKCSFELGKNLEYTFLIQQGNLRNPWQLARYNTLRILRTHEDKTFKIIFPSLTHRLQPQGNTKLPKGDCCFDVSFTTTALQQQKNFRTDNIGTYSYDSSIDFFIVDKINFEKYMNGKRFTCSQYTQTDHGSLHLGTTTQDWYLVFRNHARQTALLLDVSLQVELPASMPRVQIVTPDTTIFDTPLYPVGDTVLISGIATEMVVLTVNEISYEFTPISSVWSYKWNTAGLQPGEYLITATCGESSDETIIRLIDGVPPTLIIDEPTNGVIIEDDTLMICGESWDNVGVELIEVAVDGGEWKSASGTEHWNMTWNLSGVYLGDHTITVRAEDLSGLETWRTICFVVNESGHEWSPQINRLYHLPEQPTNTSNVVIYTNVTTVNPYAIKNVVLFWNNGTTYFSQEMYRYADFPIQPRHEEDPLKNESNAPLFGVELGQVSVGETITYWIIASDTANNTITSGEQFFTVSDR